MNKINKILCVLCVLCGVVFSSSAQTKLTSKVLLIPLDDRPPCLQMPVKMGLIGDVEVVTPPRNLLGRFTEFGKSDEIINWIRTQNLKSFDAAIISLDMLAYGGLVAMREYETTESEAMKRAEFIRQIRKLAPKMPIYGSSVIMRLAPTGNVVNESYRTNLAKWAEISVDESKKAETAELEKKIPAEALEKYKKARERDLKLNLFSVDLVKDKVIDYLILSQDDAKPNGVHIADREKLIEYVKTNNLGEKVAIQPGADEVSMLLLARSISDKYHYRPTINVVYSDEKMANQAMPFEDRPLRKTVSFHIKAVGGIEAPKDTHRLSIDFDFFVFSSRFEGGRAKTFAKEVWNGKNVVVADIDPKGDVQGADLKFVEELKSPSLLNEEKEIPSNYGNIAFMIGYASWNTAGNTIGTALPQGILAGIANDKYFDVGVFRKSQKQREKINWEEKIAFAKRIGQGHDWFIFHRLIDDYAYHSIVRPKALQMIRENKWNSLRLTDEQTKVIEDFCLRELEPYVSKMSKDYKEYSKGRCELSPISFDLPWNRTFEAEIDFRVICNYKNQSEKNNEN